MPVWLVSGWAVSFVVMTFASAVYRLGSRGLALFDRSLQVHEWVALAVCAVLFAYGEGYRALHLRFVPAVLARVAALADASPHRPGIWLVAPLCALGLVQRDRAARLRSWTGLALIVLAITVVRRLPQPWREIIDASVALALTIGIVSLVLGFARWLRETAASRSRQGMDPAQ